MINLHESFEAKSIIAAMGAVLLAMLGGMARLLYLKDEAPITAKLAIRKVFIAGVLGYLTLLCCRIVGLSGDYLGFIAGVSGLIGPEAILPYLTMFAKKFINAKEVK